MSQNSTVLPTTGILSGLEQTERINDALDTIITRHLGPSAPAITKPGMIWIDTGTTIDATGGPWIRKRNTGDTAWLREGHADADFIAELVSQVYNSATTTGTAPSFVITPLLAWTSYAADQRLRIKFHANGTGADTGNVSTLGTKNIKQYDSTGSKVAAVIVAGQLADVECDGTDLVILNPLPASGGIDPYSFYKLDPLSPVFVKTGSNTLSVKAGASAMVAGVKVPWAVDTAITMPTLTAGTDYAVYVCTDGSIRADSSTSAPTGYTTANSRKIGGFHYGLVAPGTTVAGGSFNSAGSPVGGGMVWTQTDVDNIAGINKFSLWDLKFRPACSDPRGMVLVNGRTWVDIYLCSTDTAANGTSKYNTNIASGTVLPKVPVAFGGNGTLTYSTLTWWEASELARANQKRLMLASEFYDAAFGVTENQSIDATASTYPTTLRNAGYTSKYGIEQAAGVHYTWGADSAGSASAWVSNGGRGQSYNNSVIRVLLGGSRTYGSYSGSRWSNWSDVTSSSGWSIGLRAACDHLSLV